MKTLRLCCTVIGLLLFVLNTNAVTRTAVASGNWETASTWSGSVVPACGDTIVIGSGKTVTITSLIDFATCGTAMIVNVSGILTFQTGKKLKLPCGSQINLNSGGSITSGGGGGNSNLIDICGTTVWATSMGNLSGPLVLTLTPLPVELIHFSARAEGSSVIITWMTSSQLNNDYFLIEKSTDGISFEELGKMDGAGTSTVINSYKMIDIIPVNGIQYYRLKQVDFDGKSTTSNIIATKFTRGVECNIYPNPSRGELFANIDPTFSGKKAHLIINDTEGKVVVSKEMVIESVFGFKLLQTEELLKPGSYLVSLNFKNKSFSQYVISK